MSMESQEETDFEDSALGSETSSITQSLTPSVMDFPYENGRRYHAYGAERYHIPNDEEELSRLDMQHKIWELTIGGLFRAPIDEDHIQNAMDIATGSGIWAIDFADSHPWCNVIGTDLSPVQPTAVPPNCHFIVDDAGSTEEWAFPQMDYIHSRLLVAGMRNWEQYIQRCYGGLKAGGWLELLEVGSPMQSPDGSAREDDAMMKWSRLIAEAGSKIGCDFQVQNRLEEYLEKVGFVNIKREDYQWPIGPWSDDPKQREIGKYMISNAQELIKSTAQFLTRGLGWKPEEVEVYLVECRKSIQDWKKKHRYFPMTVHYAQKPN